MRNCFIVIEPGRVGSADAYHNKKPSNSLTNWTVIMPSTDILIIGAGIVGLATAYN